jgi:hypothetical protein
MTNSSTRGSYFVARRTLLLIPVIDLMANFQAPQAQGGNLAYRKRDLDTVINIASYTIFSPVFILLIPVWYKSVKGASWTDPIVYLSSVWFLLVTATSQYCFVYILIYHIILISAEFGATCRIFPLRSKQMA